MKNVTSALNDGKEQRGGRQRGVENTKFNFGRR